MLQVIQFSVGGFDKNLSYVIVESQTAQCIIVDPTGDMSEVYACIESKSLQVIACVLTHTHADHTECLSEACEKYAVPVYVHEAGVSAVSVVDVRPVKDMDLIPFLHASIQVYYTPGHNADSICLYISHEAAEGSQPVLITGDTLFVGGCGRTTEDMVQYLFDSLERLKSLPPETMVFPGHDYGNQPQSTIGHELTTNRYLLANDFEEFKQYRLG